MARKKKKLQLVDTSWLIHRYGAIDPNANNIVNKIRGYYNTYFMKGSVILCLDTPGSKTFRHELYKKYKRSKSREASKKLIKFDVNLIHKLLKSSGLPIAYAKRYEADDIIGTLTRKWSKHFDVVIHTADKDMCQLLRGSVVIYNSKTNVTTNSAGVLTKYKITPKEFATYLALVGDSIDNIPGIAGVGPVNAAKLINSKSVPDDEDFDFWLKLTTIVTDAKFKTKNIISGV